MVKNIKAVIIIISSFFLSVSCTSKVGKVDYFNLLYYYNYSEPFKIPFNTDSLFHIIKRDTFDVSFLKYDTQLEMNDVEKSFFFTEYRFAMDRYYYFKAELYPSNILNRKFDLICPIGQFISSRNKDVKTLALLLARRDENTNIYYKDIVFFNIKNDSLRSVCSVSENCPKSFLQKDASNLITVYATYLNKGIFFIRRDMSIVSGIDGFTYNTEKNIFKRIIQADFWVNLFAKKEEIVYFYTTYLINKNGCIENCYNVRKEDFPEALKIK